MHLFQTSARFLFTGTVVNTNKTTIFVEKNISCYFYEWKPIIWANMSDCANMNIGAYTLVITTLDSRFRLQVNSGFNEETTECHSLMSEGTLGFIHSRPNSFFMKISIL